MKNSRYTILIALVALLVAFIAAVRLGSSADAAEPCVPTDAWTETIEHPEESHFETVVVTPAVDPVPGQHYSLKGNSGIDKDEVPPTPEVNPDIWQANTEQEPHDNGNGGKNITWLGTPGSGLHYASKDSEGKRDWFYFRAPVEGQDEVTKEVKVVDKEAWTETIEHPAVTCPELPTETPTPTTPTETPTPTTPTETPTPTTPTETPTPTTPTETPTPEISTPTSTSVPEPEPEDEDPVVSTETHNKPTKTIKIQRHESGKTTREVTRYDTDTLVEEGL